MDEMYEKLQLSVKTGRFLFREPMSKHTSFGIGGLCDCMYIPTTRRDLVDVLAYSRQLGIPVTVIGNGSNLLVSDKGVRGLVVKIAAPYDEITQNGEFITAQSGVLLSKLASTAQRAGLSGLEFASGIPGTVGGAVYMNAGAYDGEMKDVIVETVYLDENLREKVVNGKMHQFAYRSSMFQQERCVLLESTLRLTYGDKHEILSKMRGFNRQRKEKQPLKYHSAGSTFKRPAGGYAAQLIDEAGLKGFSIGGAQVSEKHAGFLINRNHATFQDMVELIAYVREQVLQKSGIALETEVKIIGETN